MNFGGCRLNLPPPPHSLFSRHQPRPILSGSNWPSIIWDFVRRLLHRPWPSRRTTWGYVRDVGKISGPGYGFTLVTKKDCDKSSINIDILRDFFEPKWSTSLGIAPNRIAVLGIFFCLLRSFFRFRFLFSFYFYFCNSFLYQIIKKWNSGYQKYP